MLAFFFFFLKFAPARCLAHLLLPLHFLVFLVGVSRRWVGVCAATPVSQEEAATTSNPEVELCIVSQGTVIALYTVFWMMWEHLDMTCLVLGMIIDASFLTVFFDHWYLLLSPSFIYHQKEKLHSAIFNFLIKCICQKTWRFGQRQLCCCCCHWNGCTLLRNSWSAPDGLGS